jgi:hypothetical protein
MTLALAVLWLGACGAGPSDLRPLETEELESLVGYLRQHGQPPDEYVFSRLRNNRVVFVGEMHRIRHDVLLVNELIPRLGDVGVYDLGSEFYCVEDQPTIDALLTAPIFSEPTAKELLRHGTGGTWPFREYLDLLRAAWQYNQQRPSGRPPLRVIGLIPRINYEKLNEGTEDERAAERSKGENYDRIMADALQREVLSRGRKALVHCGINHAHTRYVTRRIENGEAVDSSRKRCGTLIHASHPDSVITVFLHAPWYTFADDEEVFYLPFRGAIDQAFAAYGSPVGFDISGGPFANLTHEGAHYATGYPQFTAATIYDGYIITREIDDYEGVRIIDDWVDSPATFDYLRRQLPNRRWAASLESPEEYLQGVGRDTELNRIYADAIKRWRALEIQHAD